MQKSWGGLIESLFGLPSASRLVEKVLGFNNPRLHDGQARIWFSSVIRDSTTGVRFGFEVRTVYTHTCRHSFIRTPLDRPAMEDFQNGE